MPVNLGEPVAGLPPDDAPGSMQVCMGVYPFTKINFTWNKTNSTVPIPHRCDHILFSPNLINYIPCQRLS